MRINFFILCGIFIVCTSPCLSFGQSMPAGQLSRQSGRQMGSAHAAATSSAAIKKPSTSTAALKSPNLQVQSASPTPVLGSESQTDAVIRAKYYAGLADSASSSASSSLKAYEALINLKSLTPEEVHASKALAPLVDAVLDAATKADAASTAAGSASDAATANADADTAETESSQAVAALAEFDKQQPLTDCPVSGLDTKGNPTFNYRRIFFPLRQCNDAAKLYYFQASATASVANQVQYLYNHVQSTSQVNADLLTATFNYLGGFQTVLSGTATAGSSQNAGTPAAGAATPPTQTDSVSTAVAKLQQGGDFNIRTPFPIARRLAQGYGYNVNFIPNIGFTVNGLTGQNTVTESTQYTGNIPLEGYAEFGSIPESGKASTVIYVDAKVGAELLSSALASKIGTNSAFFLGQFSGGIEFAQSVRVGFQYFLGPSQAYCVPSTTGGCTAATGSVSGFHLVVSFTPPASKPAS